MVILVRYVCLCINALIFVSGAYLFYFNILCTQLDVFSLENADQISLEC